jgi:hypothetical protein
MKLASNRWLIAMAAALWMTCGAVGSAAEPSDASATAKEPKSTAKALPTVDEARRQAELLHETIHATLHIVHHEYYREDEGLRIPAATLIKVFDEMARRQKVQLRWLAVNAQAMNSDHHAQDAFEKEAIEALAAGKDAHEKTEGKLYRHAAPITLTADCLKCHLPNRTSTDPRTAGLVIGIPVRGE